MTLNRPQHEPNQSRLDELLADRALVGVSESEQAEIRRLLDAAGRVEDESFDLAAASLDRALNPSDLAETLPAHLLAELDHDGAAWCAGVKSATPPGVVARIHERESSAMRGPVIRGRRFIREWSGWMAAAACLAFGIYAWNNRAVTPSHSSDVQTGSMIPTEFAENLRQRAVERLNHWFNSGSCVEVVSLGTAKPETSTTQMSIGDVIWNKSEGKGVIRVTGLAPSAEGKAYQVWVYDRQRDTRFPVEGGLIKVAPGQSDVVIPLDPHVVVADASMFAVTIESDKGAVVSKGESLIGVGVPEGMAPPPVFE